MSTSEPQGTLPARPAVGDRFPDFTLPDQHGHPVAFDALRAGRAALVVVYRSADW